MTNNMDSVRTKAAAMGGASPSKISDLEAPTITYSSESDDYTGGDGADDSMGIEALSYLPVRTSNNTVAGDLVMVGTAGQAVADGIPKPSLVQRQLTETSAMFDRHGKGYLDETERALRQLDSENKGYLGIDKVCLIMESLQEEQKRSALLLDSLQKEHNKAINLKKGVFALALFTMLLALSNIGTSFAAAKLAKDTTVQTNTGDLTTLTGQRVGTTNKDVAVSMFSLTSNTTMSAHRRRHLRELQDLFCTPMIEAGRNCSIQGEITNADAALLYQQFCPNYLGGSVSRDSRSLYMPSSTSGARLAGFVCSGGGVSTAQLQCNGHFTSVYGGHLIPATGPGYNANGLMAYPSVSQGYSAVQNVPFVVGPYSYPCDQSLLLSMFCSDDVDPSTGKLPACYVFASWQPTCYGAVSVCGPESA